MGTASPRASRPYIPDYGLPTDTDTLLPWSHASERLTSATSYWLATSSGAGVPHAVPVQGIFMDDALFFRGGPDVLWARNLRVIPLAVAHIGNGEEVVILKGGVVQVTSEDHADLVEKLADAHQSKYGFRHLRRLRLDRLHQGRHALGVPAP